MANEVARRDQNYVPVLTGITDDSAQEIRMLRVDPTTGRLLISDTGSSGGSGYQTATGAVDGVNTVFTFATAPNVLMVDQVPFRKVASDGTIHWSGTTTITLLITVPSYDICAIA